MVHLTPSGKPARASRPALAFFTCLSGFAILTAGWIMALNDPYDVGQDTDLSRRFEPPGWRSPEGGLLLGTDLYGRDLARVMLHGTTAFFGPGLLTVAIGSTVGLTASLVRPRVGTWLPAELAATRAIRSLPTLAWLLLASLAGRQNPAWIAVALGLCLAPDIVAELRARFTQLYLQEVVDGSRGQGLAPWRSVFLHQAWLEGSAPLVRSAGHLFVGMMWAEAALSYLGDFGIPEPAPSWGRMLRDLSPLLFRPEPGSALWMVFVPMTAMILTSLTCTGLAHAAANHLDSYLGRGRRHLWLP